MTTANPGRDITKDPQPRGGETVVFRTPEAIYQRFEKAREVAGSSVEGRIVAASKAIEELQYLVSQKTRRLEQLVKEGQELLSASAARAGGEVVDSADLERMKAGCAFLIKRAKSLEAQAKEDLAKILGETIQSHFEETVNALEKMDPKRNKPVEVLTEEIPDEPEVAVPVVAPAAAPVTKKITPFLQKASEGLLGKDLEVKPTFHAQAIDLRGVSIGDLSGRLHELSANGKSDELVAVQKAFDRKYQWLVANSVEEMIDLPLNKLKRKISRLEKDLAAAEAKVDNEKKSWPLKARLEAVRWLIAEKENVMAVLDKDSAGRITEADDQFWLTEEGKKVIKKMEEQIRRKLLRAYNTSAVSSVEVDTAAAAEVDDKKNSTPEVVVSLPSVDAPVPTEIIDLEKISTDDLFVRLHRLEEEGNTEEAVAVQTKLYERSQAEVLRQKRAMKNLSDVKLQEKISAWDAEETKLLEGENQKQLWTVRAQLEAARDLLRVPVAKGVDQAAVFEPISPEAAKAENFLAYWQRASLKGLRWKLNILQKQNEEIRQFLTDPESLSDEVRSEIIGHFFPEPANLSGEDRRIFHERDRQELITILRTDLWREQELKKILDSKEKQGVTRANPNKVVTPAPIVAPAASVASVAPEALVAHVAPAVSAPRAESRGEAPKDFSAEKFAKECARRSVSEIQRRINKTGKDNPIELKILNDVLEQKINPDPRRAFRVYENMETDELFFAMQRLGVDERKNKANLETLQDIISMRWEAFVGHLIEENKRADVADLRQRISVLEKEKVAADLLWTSKEKGSLERALAHFDLSQIRARLAAYRELLPEPASKPVVAEALETAKPTPPVVEVKVGRQKKEPKEKKPTAPLRLVKKEERPVVSKNEIEDWPLEKLRQFIATWNRMVEDTENFLADHSSISDDTQREAMATRGDEALREEMETTKAKLERAMVAFEAKQKSA